MMPTGLNAFPWSIFVSFSFNPCSSGWCLPAFYFREAIKNAWRFQSLFFWMMPTGLYLDSLPRHLLEFQSLFFWMMPTGCSKLVVPSLLWGCFNPCSSGWCLPAPYLSDFDLGISEFQSLFFWMMPTGIENPKKIECTMKSFNPCSSGWCLPAATFPQPFD